MERSKGMESTGLSLSRDIRATTKIIKSMGEARSYAKMVQFLLQVSSFKASLSGKVFLQILKEKSIHLNGINKRYDMYLFSIYTKY
jgi:hypothetical protein